MPLFQTVPVPLVIRHESISRHANVCMFPQSQHNDTVSKLDFVLSLSELVINIARLHMSPLSSSSSLSGDQLRRVEQLVLNLHALQLLASSMQLARNELDSSRLQPSSAVRHSTCQPATDVLL